MNHTWETLNEDAKAGIVVEALQLGGGVLIATRHCDRCFNSTTQQWELVQPRRLLHETIVFVPKAFLQIYRDQARIVPP